MDYINENRAAWEEAFDRRHPGWGDDNAARLMAERLPFLDTDLAEALSAMDLSGRDVAQFCCNNGRELLSLTQLGVRSAVGFDIAENILAQARDTAARAGIGNATFVRTNILEIGDEYRAAFDLILFTIGAITWFEDLPALMQKVADCLRPGGVMLLHDFHPFMNMLALLGEPDFGPDRLDRVAYAYFRREPWIESQGAGYMSQGLTTRTFTSFSHTMADIVSALTRAGLCLTALREFDCDVGLTDAYDGRGYPLSLLLSARKG